MPAKNPRLTITLQPSLAAQLRKLSELTGNSQSSLIGELLEGSGPVFDRIIQVLEAAKTAKQAMKGKLAENMEQAQAQMEQGLGMVFEGFDGITGSLLDEAEAVTGRGCRERQAQRGRGTPGAAAPTPISNRGVRLDPIATKKIASKSTTAKANPLKTSGKSRGGKNDPL
jgi:hypothetical protein